MRASIQRAGLYERAPAALRRKLEEQSVVAASGGARARYARVASSTWQWLALAAALLLACLLGWRLLPALSGNRGQTELASAIVDAHLRSLQPGHLEDVISTDQHTVKPWFDGKVDFAPPVHDFASDGFPLQGGRLDVVQGHPGRGAGLRPPQARHQRLHLAYDASRTPSPQSGSQLGYNWVDWRKGGMEMCAVSDVTPSDLDELRKLLSE